MANISLPARSISMAWKDFGVGPRKDSSSIMASPRNTSLSI
jgi:hypothetical protein